jgi:hypothetical protein
VGDRAARGTRNAVKQYRKIPLEEEKGPPEKGISSCKAGDEATMGNSRANACGRQNAPMPVVRLGPGPGRNRGQADPTRASETVNRRPAVSFPAMHDFDHTRQPRYRGDDVRTSP